MSEYIKCFDETKYMFFLVENEKLFKTCNKVWDKISHKCKKDLIVNQCIIKNI